jgi:hypothetical protein
MDAFAQCSSMADCEAGEVCMDVNSALVLSHGNAQCGSLCICVVSQSTTETSSTSVTATRPH